MNSLTACFMGLIAVDAYRNILFAYIILSILQSMAGFAPPPWMRPAVSFVHDASEPFLRVFRGLLPGVRMGGMGLDLSPILAFLAIGFIVRPIVVAVLCP